MTVTRRKLLHALGTGALALSTVGCLADAGETGSTDTTTQPPMTTTSALTSETRTDAPTTTVDRGPQVLPERDLFDGVPCPSFTDTDRTVCWHTRSDDTVAIRPSKILFQPVAGNDEVETITFTLRNTRDVPIIFNPYSWAIKRKTETGWTHVAPDGVAKPLYELDPGKTYQWVVSPQSHPTPNTTRTRYPTVPLENGRYAFVLTGSLLDESPNTTPQSEGALAGTTVEWITLFEVQRIYR